MTITASSLAASARALRDDAATFADLVDPPSPILPYTGPLGAHLQWENNDFTITTAQTIAYGPSDGYGAGPFVSRFLQPGTYRCGSATFGDPAPGKYKAVYSVPT